MRAASRKATVLIGTVAVIVGLTACTTPAPHPTSSPLPSTYATFTGAESGRVYMDLCGTGGIDTITVVVHGTTTRLPGALSASGMSFDGKDSVYSIKKTGTQPSFSTDGRTVQLRGVTLVSVRKPSRSVTLAGQLVCP
jgi:hypothetical protein